VRATVFFSFSLCIFARFRSFSLVFRAFLGGAARRFRLFFTDFFSYDKQNTKNI